jgi:hypothetical protein
MERHDLLSHGFRFSCRSYRGEKRYHNGTTTAVLDFLSILIEEEHVPINVSPNPEVPPITEQVRAAGHLGGFLIAIGFKL